MAFVVEDGSGKEDANAYGSLSDSEEYFEDRGISAWASADDDDKQAAIVRATTWIDSEYTFAGRKVAKNQGLAFPRFGMVDSDGFAIESDEIPKCLIHATFEAAFRIISGDSLFETLTKSVLEESVGQGAVAVKYDSNSPDGSRYPYITNMLSDLLESGYGVIGVTVRA